MKLLITLSAALLVVSAGAGTAAATERHFGFNYESGTLTPGRSELTPWSTVRAGRADYYSSIEARLGFQVGLFKNFQGALFWNLSSVTEDVRLPGAALKSRLSASDFQSLTVQLKYKLSDPVADALGSALLVDGFAGPLAVGFEGRLILDEQIGSWLLAANLVGGASEQLELNSRALATFGATLGLGYFVTPNLVTGLEVRNENRFSGEIDHSVLYVGPSVAYVSARYWLVFAAEPQVLAWKGVSPRHRLDLDRNEYVQTRLLLGFAL